MDTTLNKILLATYGSENADEFATHTAIRLARGRSVIGRALMGSVSDSVVRHARCPVVVARSQEADDKRKETLSRGVLPGVQGKREGMERYSMGHRTRSSSVLKHRSGSVYSFDYIEDQRYGFLLSNGDLVFMGLVATMIRIYGAIRMPNAATKL